MHTKASWVIQNQVPLIPVWVHWFPSSHQHLQRLKGCSCVWGRGMKEQQQGKHQACSALVGTHWSSLTGTQMKAEATSSQCLQYDIYNSKFSWSRLRWLCINFAVITCKTGSWHLAVRDFPYFKVRSCSKTFVIFYWHKERAFNELWTRMLKQPLFHSWNQFSFFTISNITHPRYMIMCNIYCIHSSLLVRRKAAMFF